jgi:hypothetical protein
MATLFIIFIWFYMWNIIKEDCQVFFAALFGFACVMSELLTGAALINMTGDFIGGLIL